MPIEILFAVMETEAWFLAESSHFPRIHPSLSNMRILSEFGFNPETDNMELRDHPASDLHAIYSIVGLAYKKHRNQVERTVEALDYENLYTNVQMRINSLRRMIEKLDTFFTN